MRQAIWVGSFSAPWRAPPPPCLMAPKSGRETRELFAERGGDWFKKAQDAAGDTQSRAGDIFDKGREYFEEQTQRLTSAFEAGRTAMKEEIDRGQSGV